MTQKDQTRHDFKWNISQLDQQHFHYNFVFLHLLTRVAWILRSHWHFPKILGLQGHESRDPTENLRRGRGTTFGQGCEALRIKDLRVADQTERRMGSPSEVPLLCKRMYIYIYIHMKYLCSKKLVCVCIYIYMYVYLLDNFRILYA